MKQILLCGWCIVLFVVVSSFVLGVYEPLGVIGVVHENDVPVVNASVWLKASVSGVEVARSDVVFTNSQGLFYNVVTLHGSSVVDVEVIIESDEVFVELLENVSSWNDYIIRSNIATDVFGSFEVVEKIDSSSQIDFFSDLESLESGEVSDELIEKYDIVIEEVPHPQVLEPVVEQPGSVQQVTVENKQRIPRLVWEVCAILLLGVAIFVIRFEVRRH